MLETLHDHPCNGRRHASTAASRSAGREKLPRALRPRRRDGRPPEDRETPRPRTPRDPARAARGIMSRVSGSLGHREIARHSGLPSAGLASRATPWPPGAGLEQERWTRSGRAAPGVPPRPTRPARAGGTDSLDAPRAGELALAQRSLRPRASARCAGWPARHLSSRKRSSLFAPTERRPEDLTGGSAARLPMPCGGAAGPHRGRALVRGPRRAPQARDDGPHLRVEPDSRHTASRAMGDPSRR